MKPIEYLSPYLPYELQIVVSHRTQPDAIVHLTPAYLGDSTGIKPILRPLSDLTKEIEHNGEKFVPSTELKLFIKCDIEWWQNHFNLKYGEWNNVQKLISWHFDIFNLHEKGQCIYYDEI